MSVSKVRKTSAARSSIMARIKSKNTTPELLVRHLVFGLGYRYRIHDNSLPGCPDIVFRKRSKAIFVNGCFWHGHNCRAGRNRPVTNAKYWEQKLNRNVERDRVNRKLLRKLGWNHLTVWECKIKDPSLTKKISRFLGPKK